MCRRSWKPAASQTLRNSGNQGLLVLLKVVQKRLRHRPLVGLVGRRRAVAGVDRHPHFVLHLHHHDRVLLGVHFLDVPHQGRKGPRIGVPRRIAVALDRGEELQTLAAAGLAQGKRL